jgi:beta-galactosidase/beta-glucuronidase
VTFDVFNPEGGEVSLTLRDPDKNNKIVAKTRKCSSVGSRHLDVELSVANPKKWTAEIFVPPGNEPLFFSRP